MRISAGARLAIVMSPQFPSTPPVVPAVPGLPPSPPAPVPGDPPWIAGLMTTPPEPAPIPPPTPVGSPTCPAELQLQDNAPAPKATSTPANTLPTEIIFIMSPYQFGRFRERGLSNVPSARPQTRTGSRPLDLTTTFKAIAIACHRKPRIPCVLGQPHSHGLLVQHRCGIRCEDLAIRSISACDLCPTPTLISVCLGQQCRGVLAKDLRLTPCAQVERTEKVKGL